MIVYNSHNKLKKKNKTLHTSIYIRMYGKLDNTVIENSLNRMPFDSLNRRVRTTFFFFVFEAIKLIFVLFISYTYISHLCMAICSQNYVTFNNKQPGNFTFHSVPTFHSLCAVFFLLLLLLSNSSSIPTSYVRTLSVCSAFMGFL